MRPYIFDVFKSGICTLILDTASWRLDLLTVSGTGIRLKTALTPPLVATFAPSVPHTLNTTGDHHRDVTLEIRAGNLRSTDGRADEGRWCQKRKLMAGRLSEYRVTFGTGFANATSFWSKSNSCNRWP